jgi:hypothetical protein
MGHSSSEKIIFSFCHLSADKWDPPVSFIVNWLQICDLSKLQSICGKVVDFGCQNVKWYHLINFA